MGRRATSYWVTQVRARLAECEGAPSEELIVGVWEPWSGLCVVALRGEMDMSNAAALSRAVGRHVGAASFDLIVELSQLTFIDSCGITELVKLSKTLDVEGGVIVLAAPTAPVARLFGIVKLGDRLVIAESLEDALAHISSPPTVRSAGHPVAARNQKGLHEGTA